MASLAKAVRSVLSRERSAWKAVKGRAPGLLGVPVVNRLLVAHFLGFSRKRVRAGGSEATFLAPRHAYRPGEVGGVDRDGVVEGPLVQAFIDSLRPESVVIDIGGGCGVFALIACAHTRARVVVIEPDPLALLYLRRNLRGRGYQLVTKPVGGLDDRQTITIDRLCEERGLAPTHIKMDIEGYEIAALQGMRLTLRRHRPQLFVEFHERLIRERLGLPEAAMAAFFETLRELGYRLRFNGHHYAMHTSQKRRYSYDWHPQPPNRVNYAVVADPVSDAQAGPASASRLRNNASGGSGFGAVGSGPSKVECFSSLLRILGWGRC